MSKLSVGTHVDIQRSDGRIHSAFVSNIDWKSRNVTVKWSESEKIEVKKISLESIFRLNPNLCEPQNQSVSIPRKIIPIAPNSNSGDLCHDLYTIHESISHLQEMEEVLDLHKSVIDNYPLWNESYLGLFQMTSHDDYDIGAYTRLLENLLDDNLDVLIKFKKRVTSFRSQLIKGEIKS